MPELALALTRSELLRRGVLLAASGTALGAVEAPAASADIPDVDLSYLRLLVGAELLKTDFETRALATRALAAPATRVVRRMRADDLAHYHALAALLSGAGQSAATAADIDFAYPRGTFQAQRSIAARAWKLVTVSLGGYLGALEAVQTPQLRRPLGQIAANEAQQVSALAQLLGRPTIGGAFAASLPIDAVSAALDEYES